MRYVFGANPPLEERARSGGKGLGVYLRRYRSQLPIDSERLRYWEALNVFDWWSMLAGLDLADPVVVGLRADVRERLRGGQIERIRNYFMGLTKPSSEW